MATKKTEKPKNKGGRPPKFTDVKKLSEDIEAYFKKCDKEKDPYTITGLALFLNCDKETLLTYKGKKKFSVPIKRAYLRVENYAEKALYRGQMVAGPIFWLKNFGWKDKSEVDHTTKGQAITPILGGATNVHKNDSNKQSPGATEEN